MDSEHKVAVLEIKLQHMEKDLGDLREEITKIEAREREREREEKNRLLWGIGALGSVITALGTIIWSYRSVIFK